ncbi:MAG: uracil-DNA glycosylase [Casimicrobiaceae bacterium]
MMATREEILEELGLAPVWRLRRTPSTAGDRSSMTMRDDAAHPTTVAPFPSVTHAAPDVHVIPAAPDVRVTRIATLDWSALRTDILGCTACGLSRTRRQAVPGVGDMRADWLFVGEAPGADEDAQGEPFVGQAGKLLDAMLAAIGVSRGEAVYIANVLKCRPPNNRTPEPAEVDACKPYLDRQIALIGPRLIVALGRSAAATLLGADASIASLRGRIHRYGDVPLLVTYHPAYLLRNLPDKAKAWEDLLLARRTLREAGTAGSA